MWFDLAASLPSPWEFGGISATAVPAFLMACVPAVLAARATLRCRQPPAARLLHIPQHGAAKRRAA